MDNANRLRFDLRSDGILYYLSGGIRALVKQKSPTRVQIQMWRDDVLFAPETGDLGSGRFRDRIVKLATNHFGEDAVERLAEELGAVAAFLDQNLREREEAAAGDAGRTDVPELVGTPYVVIDGSIWYRRNAQGGEALLIPLTNFLARVEEEIVVDDGAETRRLYRISGEAGGVTLSPVDVPATDFGSMGWVAPAWGMKARLSAGPGVRDRTREAFELLSAGAPVKRLYAHTGFRMLPDGRRVYLHGGGAIGADGVGVELGPGLERYVLPLPGADMSALAADVRVSFRFLDVAPPDVAAPLLCAAYLALLSGFCQPDFLLWLYGETGAYKSSLAAVLLSHFGDFTEMTLPLSFESTSNALEKTLFSLKDILAVVDDWRPGVTASDAADMERKAQRLQRAVGNRQGRGRMTAQTDLRRSYAPRGVVLATAEALPEGPTFQSANARALALGIAPGDVDTAVLSGLQSQRPALGRAMAGYAMWVAERHDGLSERAPAFRERVRSELRPELPGAHPRTPDAAAALRVGLATLCAYAASTGVAEEEVERFRSRAAAGILEAAKAHVESTKGGDPATRFTELLRSLFAAGAAYARDRRTGGHPPAREELGWEEAELASAEPYRPVRGAQWVGWADANDLYLEEEAAYAAVSAFARRGGIPFGIKPRVLWGALKRAGVSFADEGRSNTTAKIQGKTRRVVQVPRQAVLGGVEDDA